MLRRRHAVPQHPPVEGLVTKSFDLDPTAREMWWQDCVAVLPGFETGRLRDVRKALACAFTANKRPINAQ